MEGLYGLGGEEQVPCLSFPPQRLHGYLSIISGNKGQDHVDLRRRATWDFPRGTTTPLMENAQEERKRGGLVEERET